VRRREAILLFREICECIPGLFVNSVSLLRRNNSKEVTLRINMLSDVESIKIMRSIVETYGLILEEEKGALLIHGSHSKKTEIKIIA
jgi:hypothetical protein